MKPMGRKQQGDGPSTSTRTSLAPALSVLVYRSPGPAAERAELEARDLWQEMSPWHEEGRFEHVTLPDSVFDDVWEQVNGGDSLAAAWAVLAFLGLLEDENLRRVEDVFLAWVGGTEVTRGKLLLLQLFPAPDVGMMWN